MDILTLIFAALAVIGVIEFILLFLIYAWSGTIPFTIMKCKLKGVPLIIKDTAVKREFCCPDKKGGLLQVKGTGLYLPTKGRSPPLDNNMPSMLVDEYYSVALSTQERVIKTDAEGNKTEMPVGIGLLASDFVPPTPMDSPQMLKRQVEELAAEKAKEQEDKNKQVLYFTFCAVLIIIALVGAKMLLDSSAKTEVCTIAMQAAKTTASTLAAGQLPVETV